MINIISQFLINSICSAKSVHSINVYMKNQSVIQHNAITIVQTIHVCLHHIRTHRLVHVRIHKKLVGANIKSTIHLGDSYILREKTHGTKK